MSKVEKPEVVGKPNFMRSVTITMPLDVAEVLHALIDGSIGSSDSDNFNNQMIPIRDKLERRINKHYA